MIRSNVKQKILKSNATILKQVMQSIIFAYS